MESFDVTIIGGGIVGLSIAKHLSKKKNVLLLEKEKEFLQHTSSRNSEVIHSGIYYKKNSLKHIHCLRGKNLLYEYCLNRDVPHKKLGKLIISNDKSDSKLFELYQNGSENGVRDLKWLAKEEIRQYENNISANHAIFSPSSGIVDTHILGHTLANEANENGAILLRKTELLSATHKNGLYEISIKNPDNSLFSFTSCSIINAAGHEALEVNKRIDSGINLDNCSPFPVKGNYFSYSGRHNFKYLIYPMPDELGLGIHSTINLANELKFGPDVELNNITLAVNEERRDIFFNSVKKWWPEIEHSKLAPNYVGIRPKVKIDGKIFSDYLIKEEEVNFGKYIVLLGIESPGITASLSLAESLEEAIK